MKRSRHRNPFRQQLEYTRTLITSAHQVQDMPVRIEEFETGELPTSPSVPEQVLTYLHANRDKAFTRSEIAIGINEDQIRWGQLSHD